MATASIRVEARISFEIGNDESRRMGPLRALPRPAVHIRNGNNLGTFQNREIPRDIRPPVSVTDHPEVHLPPTILNRPRLRNICLDGSVSGKSDGLLERARLHDPPARRISRIQQAPEPRITAIGVRRRISRSSHSDHDVA